MTKGAIQSFDVALLNPHGGDLNGFFLIRAGNTELNDLMATDEWLKHIVRGELHEEGMGVIGGITGELAMERIKLWMSLIPK
jgi:hypothetical protein